MAARLLVARQEGDVFVVAIHLDEAKVLYRLEEATDEAGNPVRVRVGDPFPDPEWVFERRWGPETDPAQAIRESTLLAAEALARREPAAGEPHAMEGARLDLAASLREAAEPGLPVAQAPAESSGDQAAQA
jgi:hypothetical protein